MLPEDFNEPRKNAKIFNTKEAWKPKEWSPHYEEIVAMSCTGVSNKYLAEKFNYHEVHISNILNTPQAKALKQIILAKMREAQTEAKIPERIAELQVAALDIMREVLINRKDELVKESPFAMLDRSMKVLAGVGVFKGEHQQTTINQHNKIEINQTLQMALVKTIEKADEAKRLHDGNNKSGD